MKSLIGLFVILLLATQAVSQELTSTLHSTLFDIQVAFVDEMVIFTCVVRGSDNMAWTSEEYIGSGGQQLPFAAAETEGSVRRAIENNQTVATLITAVNTGDIMIESELRIRINSIYPVASVHCISRGADIAMVNSTSFQLADAPFVDCDKRSVCPGETVICTCATGNSNTLAWMINGSRVQFMSNDTVPTRRNISTSNSFAILTENSDVNGIRVIISNLTVSASSESTDDIVLTCQNVDRTVTTPLIVPITAPETCRMNPSDVTPTENGNTGASDSSIIAAVVVPLIIIVIVVVITMAIIYFFMYKRVQAKLKEQGEKIASLENDKRIQGEKIASLENDKQIQGEKIASLENDKQIQDQLYKEEKKNIERRMAQQVGQKGKESERLQKELKDMEDAIEALPAKMKAEVNKILEEKKGNSQERKKTPSTGPSTGSRFSGVRQGSFTGSGYVY